MKFLDYPRPSKDKENILKNALGRKGNLLCEHEAYAFLKDVGLAVCEHIFYPADTKSNIKLDSGKQYVAKAMLQGEIHKTERGAIAFNINSGNADEIFAGWKKTLGADEFHGVLFVEQIPRSEAELLVGFYRDDFFGPVLAVGLGGTSTEYYGNVMQRGRANIFWPAEADLGGARDLVKRLSVVDLIEGRIRGKGKLGSADQISEILKNLQQLVLSFSNDNPACQISLSELEVNPAAFHDGKFWMLDAVVRAKEKTAPAVKKPLSKIKSLLSPQSAIVAGASSKNSNSPASIILKKLHEAGIGSDNLYVLHPKESEVMGFGAYKTVDEILEKRSGKPVDVFVVGVPAEAATSVMLDALDKRAADSYEVISSGFGEVKSGRERQLAIEAKLESLPMRERPVINGPNTLGNIYGKHDTLFTPAYKSSSTGRGLQNAALICQSGAFMITRLSDLSDVLSPKAAISVGNQLDLSAVDFLEFMEQEHRDIDVYGLYIEGLKPNEGERLLKIAEDARSKDKLIVIYKAGRTKEGQEATKSHTAAMAGDYHMFADFASRAGAVVADSAADFQNIFVSAAYWPDLIKLKRKEVVKTAALSNAGFEKCSLADHLFEETSKLRAANYTEATMQKIRDIYARYKITGLVDIGTVLDIGPMVDDEGYVELIRTLLADENADVGIFSIVPETVMLNTLPKSTEYSEDFAKPRALVPLLADLRKESKKPFVMSVESGVKYEPIRRALLDAKIPCFSLVESAAKVISKLVG